MHGSSHSKCKGSPGKSIQSIKRLLDRSTVEVGARELERGH